VSIVTALVPVGEVACRCWRQIKIVDPDYLLPSERWVRNLAFAVGGRWKGALAGSRKRGGCVPFSAMSPCVLTAGEEG
jgi:hypothetical protein